MRENWNCPDLKAPLLEGVSLPVPSTDYEFPDCPAAYLRTKHDVELLTIRYDRPAFAEHLVDGTHAASLVSQVASELKAGARMAESLSPGMLELAHLFISEENKREAYNARERRRDAQRKGRA